MMMKQLGWVDLLLDPPPRRCPLSLGVPLPSRHPRPRNSGSVCAQVRRPGGSASVDFMNALFLVGSFSFTLLSETRSLPLLSPSSRA